MKEKRRKSKILLTMVSFDKVVFVLILIAWSSMLNMVFEAHAP